MPDRWPQPKVTTDSPHTPYQPAKPKKRNSFFLRRNDGTHLLSANHYLENHFSQYSKGDLADTSVDEWGRFNSESIKAAYEEQLDERNYE